MPRFVVERTFPDGLAIPVTAEGLRPFTAYAGGTEAERSGLMEHHQLSALVLNANGVHSSPYRFLQHTHEFLKCLIGVIWHDVPFS